MVLIWILKCLRLNISSSVRLDDAGVGRPLATVVAGNPKDLFVFLKFLCFYLQILDNHFIPVYLLVFTGVTSCNLFFINEIRGSWQKKIGCLSMKLNNHYTI
jgi:hypothetical protein